MIHKLLEKYSIAEKKRLNSPETYFLLKKSSLAKKGIFIFSSIFLVVYIITALLLNGKICYFWPYIIFSYLGGLGAWALIHQKVYRYVFSDEIKECRLHVHKIEKFMMKYMGTFLGLLYISVSMWLFLYSVGIIEVSFLPDLCFIREASSSYDSYNDAIKKCIDTCTIDTFISKM